MIGFIAAIIAAIIFTGMMVFQFLLALGLPIGHLAWGGKYKELPTNLRIASGVSIGIFLFAVLMVLERIKLINLFNNPWVSLIAVWLFAVYFTIGILMNAASRSKWEKQIMTPIATISAVCCYLVAIFA